MNDLLLEGKGSQRLAYKVANGSETSVLEQETEMNNFQQFPMLEILINQRSRKDA